MTDQPTQNLSGFDTPSPWREVALKLLVAPATAAECPLCHANSVTATWLMTETMVLGLTVDLTCSACQGREQLKMVLPSGSKAFWPPERFGEFFAVIQNAMKPAIMELAQEIQKTPAAAFTMHPKWVEAKWSATTFRGDAISPSPPLMGLVFDNAEAGLEIFRDLERKLNHVDRFEEIRVSIIEDAQKPEAQRPPYTVHLSPDAASLAAQGKTKIGGLETKAAAFLGQWNRHYPPANSPPMLSDFKRAFAKHKEFMLAPAVKRADGQLWFEPTIGIIKRAIQFRQITEISKKDDPDTAALVIPQFITPPT